MSLCRGLQQSIVKKMFLKQILIPRLFFFCIVEIKLKFKHQNFIDENNKNPM